MICEKCGDNAMAGRLVVRRTFEGFACHPCADEVKRIEWEDRTMAKKNGKAGKGGVVAGAKKVAGKDGGGREGSLSILIDPLLLAGGHTIKEIAAELAKKAGDAAKDRDLAANVRARMVSYTRKGWQVKKDDQKRVMVVQQKG